jgi:hypothetical protein
MIRCLAFARIIGGLGVVPQRDWSLVSLVTTGTVGTWRDRIILILNTSYKISPSDFYFYNHVQKYQHVLCHKFWSTNMEWKEYTIIMILWQFMYFYSTIIIFWDQTLISSIFSHDSNATKFWFPYVDCTWKNLYHSINGCYSNYVHVFHMQKIKLPFL